MPCAFDGSIEKHEDKQNLQKHLRLERLHQVREQEKQRSMHRCLEYKNIINDRKAVRAQIAKSKKIIETVNKHNDVIDTWKQSLIANGTAMNAAKENTLLLNQQLHTVEDKKRMLNEHAMKRDAIARHELQRIAKLNQDQANDRALYCNTYREFSIQSREDARKNAESKAASSSSDDVRHKTGKVTFHQKGAEQSAESIEERGQVIIHAVIQRHGRPGRDSSTVTSNVIEASSLSYRRAWNCVMSELLDKRKSKVRSYIARKTKRKEKEVDMMEVELLALHNIDRTGSRVRRTKSVEMVAPNTESPLILNAFEKTFLLGKSTSDSIAPSSDEPSAAIAVDDSTDHLDTDEVDVEGIHGRRGGGVHGILSTARGINDNTETSIDDDISVSTYVTIAEDVRKNETTLSWSKVIPKNALRNSSHGTSSGSSNVHSSSSNSSNYSNRLAVQSAPFWTVAAANGYGITAYDDEDEEVEDVEMPRTVSHIPTPTRMNDDLVWHSMEKESLPLHAVDSATKGQWYVDYPAILPDQNDDMESLVILSPRKCTTPLVSHDIRLPSVHVHQSSLLSSPEASVTNSVDFSHKENQLILSTTSTPTTISTTYMPSSMQSQPFLTELFIPHFTSDASQCVDTGNNTSWISADNINDTSYMTNEDNIYHHDSDASTDIARHDNNTDAHFTDGSTVSISPASSMASIASVQLTSRSYNDQLYNVSILTESDATDCNDDVLDDVVGNTEDDEAGTATSLPSDTDILTTQHMEESVGMKSVERTDGSSNDSHYTAVGVDDACEDEVHTSGSSYVGGQLQDGGGDDAGDVALSNDDTECNHSTDNSIIDASFALNSLKHCYVSPMHSPMNRSVNIESFQECSVSSHSSSVSYGDNAIDSVEIIDMSVDSVSAAVHDAEPYTAHDTSDAYADEVAADCAEDNVVEELLASEYTADVHAVVDEESYAGVDIPSGDFDCAGDDGSVDDAYAYAPVDEESYTEQRMSSCACDVKNDSVDASEHTVNDIHACATDEDVSYTEHSAFSGAYDAEDDTVDDAYAAIDTVGYACASEDLTITYDDADETSMLYVSADRSVDTASVSSPMRSLIDTTEIDDAVSEEHQSNDTNGAINSTSDTNGTINGTISLTMSSHVQESRSSPYLLDPKSSNLDRAIKEVNDAIVNSSVVFDRAYRSLATSTSSITDLFSNLSTSDADRSILDYYRHNSSIDISSHHVPAMVTLQDQAGNKAPMNFNELFTSNSDDDCDSNGDESIDEALSDTGISIKRDNASSFDYSTASSSSTSLATACTRADESTCSINGNNSSIEDDSILLSPTDVSGSIYTSARSLIQSEIHDLKLKVLQFVSSEENLKQIRSIDSSRQSFTLSSGTNSIDFTDVFMGKRASEKFHLSSSSSSSSNSSSSSSSSNSSSSSSSSSSSVNESIDSLHQSRDVPLDFLLGSASRTVLNRDLDSSDRVVDMGTPTSTLSEGPLSVIRSSARSNITTPLSALSSGRLSDLSESPKRYYQRFTSTTATTPHSVLSEGRLSTRSASPFKRLAPDDGSVSSFSYDDDAIDSSPMTRMSSSPYRV